MSSTAPPDIDTLLAHAGLVRSLARAALGRDEDVEDVVQDTWLAALRRGPSRLGEREIEVGETDREVALELLVTFE